MNKEEKLEYARQKSADFRRRRKEAGLSSRGGAAPLRQLKSGKAAEQNRMKAKRHYDKMLMLDPDGTRARGREHQKKLRWRSNGGPVKELVANAIKRVLLPYRRNDRKKKRIATDVARAKERRHAEPQVLSRCRIRSRINTWLRVAHPLGQKGKSTTTMLMVGCTQQQFYTHMKHQWCDFDPSIHEIDHVFPLACYDVVDLVQQSNAVHFSNSQPLTVSENRWKSDKLPTKAMAAKVDRNKWPPGVTEDMLPDIYPGWATPLRMHAAPTAGASSSTDPVDEPDDVSDVSSDDDVSEASSGDVSEVSSDDEVE